MDYRIKVSPAKGEKVGKYYKISEPGEANLLREIFPYVEPPRVPFDDEVVPMNPPEDIWVTDTTFRDGQQALEPYTVTQIVNLYKMMNRLGGPAGVIRQCEFFLYTKKDREAVEKVRELGYRYPEVTGWIRAQIKDFQLVKEMGLQETGILTSMSDYHIFRKLKKTRREDAISGYMDIVKAAADAGLKAVRCHFEDMTRADFWGACVPFAQRLMDFAQESKMKVKIRMCDTMGYGVPWPQAALPRSIPKIVYYLNKEAGVPYDCLEMHMHNDFHMVVANSVTGWLYGASAVNTTLLSFGERTGNAPLEGMLFWYIGLKGGMSGIDTSVITEIKEYYEKEIGLPVPPRYPFVGEKFNITMAGIHADGMIKDEEIYNIFDTKRLLNRPPGVAITDKTGMAGIAMWLETKIGKDIVGTIDKKDPKMAEIEKQIVAQYEAGRVSAMSDEEMAGFVKMYFPQWWTPEVKKRLREKGVSIEKVEAQR
jgi:isopropylmalate/homocitrate/citramalate synthase